MPEKDKPPVDTFQVELEHVAAPDAQRRLAKAYQVILEAAARAEEPAETKREDGSDWMVNNG